MKHCLYALAVLLLFVSGSSSLSAQHCLDLSDNETLSNEYFIRPTAKVTPESDGFVVTYSIPHVMKKPDPLFDGLFCWEIPGFGQIDMEGYPALPFKNDSFTLPDGCDSVRVTMLHADAIPFTVNVAPARIFGDREISKDDVAPVSHDLLIPADKVATLASIGNYRENKVAHILVQPASYKYTTHQLEMYNKFSYKVEFLDESGNPITVSGDGDSKGPAKIKDPYAGCVIINDTYLIISNLLYKEPIDRLVAFKQQQGFDVRVSYKDKWQTTSVKDTIAHYYENTNLTHVLIVGGDHDVPGISDFCYVKGRKTWYNSDYKYACLTEKQLSDLPDVFIGRIACNKNKTKSGRSSISINYDYVSGISSAIDKIIEYEGNPSDDDSFYNTSLHCAYFQNVDNHKESVDPVFVHTSEIIRDYVMKQGKTVMRSYKADDGVEPMYYWDGDYITSDLINHPEKWNGCADSISKHINKGCFYVLYSGHGTDKGWSKPRFDVNIDSKNVADPSNNNVNSLTNNGKYPVIFSMSCETGNYVANDCLSTEFLNKKGGGAVGVVASTVTMYSLSCDKFKEGIFNSIWPSPGLYAELERDSVIGWDPRQPYQITGISTPKTHQEKYTFGAIVQGAQSHVNYYIGSASEENGPLMTVKKSFHLFGDPSMLFHTETPKEYSSDEVSLKGSGSLKPTNSMNVEINMPDGEIAYVGVYDYNTKERKRYAVSNMSIPVSYNVLMGKICFNQDIYVYGVNRVPKMIVQHTSLPIVGPIKPFEYKLTITPNPVSSVANISFSVSSIDREHHLLIHDWNGIEVKRIDVPLNEYSVNVNVDDLPNGNYVVSLIVNGNKQVAEQMIVAK